MNRVSCICLIVALSFVMIACHTTEENYRAAYELARGGDNEDDDENRVNQEEKAAKITGWLVLFALN